MRSNSALLRLVPLALVAMALGCSSNNKGKIEGTKWSSTASTIKGQTLPAGVMQLEFTKDGKLVFQAGPVTYTGRYSLRPGDIVTFTLDQTMQGSKVHQQRIVIRGEMLTLYDTDGTNLTFSKTGGPPSPPTATAGVPAAPTPTPGAAPPQPAAAPPSPSPASSSAFPPPAAQGPPVNLLASVNPARDQLRGEWKREGGCLTVVPSQAATLVIPATVPAEYSVTVVAERTIGNDSLNIGLVVGGRQTMLALEGWGVRASGLNTVAGRTADNNETTFRTPVFNPGTPATIVCTVRKTSVVVVCNGLQVMAWAGDPQILGLDTRFWTDIPSDKLFLGAWEAGFRISKMELVPVK